MFLEATQTVIRKSKEIIGNIADGEAQINLIKVINDLCQYSSLPDIIGIKNRVADKVISENKYCF